MASQQIATYRQMSELSASMVEAARAQDWDRLVDVEREVTLLRDRLKGYDDNAGLSPDDRTLKATLIQRILDDDAEIRRHTEPWMDHVRQFLGGTARRRVVEQAYGTGS